MSDAQLLDLSAARELPFKYRLGHEDRRKQVREKTDDEGYGEALYGRRSEDEQESARYHRRHVGIDDGKKSAREPGVYCRSRRLARPKFLTDTFEDQDVG